MLALAFVSIPAVAQNCASDGALLYLGNTRDASRSLWLSKNHVPGDFALEAQGHQTVDSWSKDRRGLRLSQSPVVSSGNGGVHKLYKKKPNCLIAKANQKVVWEFPDRPPGGWLPNLPDLPPIGPDEGPPLGPNQDLPPLAPGAPNQDLPPLTGIPDQGLPPIPGLPDQGLPPLVGIPDQGLPPIQPPIKPPIEPPTKPPTKPPTQSPPAQPQPPIKPPGPTPPAENKPVTLPRMAQDSAPIGARRDEIHCIDPRGPAPAPGSDAAELPACPSVAPTDANRDQVPMTAGRDLGPPTRWNAWSEGNLYGVDDKRYGLDTEIRAGIATFGVDRRIGDEVIAGLAVSYGEGDTDAFDDSVRVGSSGYSFGPYVAVRLSDHWAVDAWLIYGRHDNNVELVTLKGEYASRRYAGLINLYGQYRHGGYVVRPKATVSYSHLKSDTYDLSGDVGGTEVVVRFAEDRFDFGVLQVSAEIGRVFHSDGGPTMPFVEFGTRYEFERPNDGYILTGNLKLAQPSRWSGSLRSGVRMFIARSLQLEASAGYLSFGQDGLDAWEGKLLLSYGF